MAGNSWHKGQALCASYLYWSRYGAVLTFDHMQHCAYRRVEFVYMKPVTASADCLWMKRTVQSECSSPFAVLVYSIKSLPADLEISVAFLPLTGPGCDSCVAEDTHSGGFTTNAVKKISPGDHSHIKLPFIPLHHKHTTAPHSNQQTGAWRCHYNPQGARPGH